MSVIMHAFCEGCGNEVSVCRQCHKKASSYTGSSCNDCSPSEVKLCFLCLPCQKSRKQTPPKDSKTLSEDFIPLNK